MPRVHPKPSLVSTPYFSANDQTSETPRESALRFCVANLLAIESALGVDHGDGNEYSEAVGYGGMGEAGYGSDGRDTLRDVCMTIVEDAINAVLLGLRKRVRSLLGMIQTT